MTDAITRRNVLGSAAVVAGVPLLAACAGESDESAGHVPSELPEEGTLLGATDAIPEGGCVVFAQPPVVVTQPEAGEFRAFSAECTHQGCLVQSSSTGVIPCPCHGSEFDLATGEVVGGRAATEPLPEVSIEIRDGEIYTV